MMHLKKLEPLGIKDVIFIFMLIIIAIVAIVASLSFGVQNMQKRIDILSEKVRVLEYQMKDNSGEHVYTSGIKETI